MAVHGYLIGIVFISTLSAFSPTSAQTYRPTGKITDMASGQAVVGAAVEVHFPSTGESVSYSTNINQVMNISVQSDFVSCILNIAFGFIYVPKAVKFRKI